METASPLAFAFQRFLEAFIHNKSARKKFETDDPNYECLGLLEGDLPRNKKEGVFNPNFITIFIFKKI